METSDGSGPKMAQRGYAAFFLKAAIAGVVVFFGIVAGVYTALSFHPTLTEFSSPDKLTNNTLLEIGDEFPDYVLTNPEDSSTVSVSELTNQGPVLLVFVSGNCGACRTMARFWEKRVIDELREDVKLVLVYDENDYPNAVDSSNVLHIRNSLTVVTDRSSQSDDDGIIATPTFIGLGKTREIRFVMEGFQRDIHADFINSNL